MWKAVLILVFLDTEVDIILYICLLNDHERYCYTTKYLAPCQNIVYQKKKRNSYKYLELKVY